MFNTTQVQNITYILNTGSIFCSIKITLPVYDTALEYCGFKLNTFLNPIWIYISTYLSSPTIIMGSLGLNSTWVSLVFFFWATICSQRGSYLLIFKSYTNIWKWIKQKNFKTLHKIRDFDVSRSWFILAMCIQLCVIPCHLQWLLQTQ